MIFMALMTPSLNYLFHPFTMPIFLEWNERALLDVQLLKDELSANFQGSIGIISVIDFALISLYNKKNFK